MINDRRRICIEMEGNAKVLRPSMKFCIEGVSTTESLYAVPGTNDFIVNGKIYVCMDNITAFDMAMGASVRITFEDIEEELCKKADRDMKIVSEYRDLGKYKGRK